VKTADFMAKTEKRRIGDIGEEVVCKYLTNKGYVVRERNYWKPWGEIDIIAENIDFISFVEVKTVSKKNGEEEFSRETVRPEENMHPAKLKRLHRAVQTYLLDRKIPESREWRIDLACVYLDHKAKRAKVEMLENIIL
jgi:putative endonuclease